MSTGDGGQPGRGVLSGAAFLACSWTWCVGMWLPVYLMHDFGALGWVAFAVPNVIGAGAVGFVHRTPESAARFRARGLGAMRWFSVVTILFHVGFLGWMFAAHRPPMVPAIASVTGPLLAVLVGLGLSRLGSRGWGWLALATLPAAPILMTLVLRTTAYEGLDLPAMRGTVTSPGALALYATGLAFGFLLCPHLDFSILRVREERAGGTGDAAFVVGFGGFFLGLIALTALYGSGVLGGWFSFYLHLHFLVQGTFTVGAHLRELRVNGWPRGLGRGRAAPIGFVALAVGCAALPALTETVGTVLGKPSTRVVYESFLWFYALPLPAAAWFLLRGRRLGRVFWGAVALATPAIAAGALWGVWWAIPVGVAIPLAAGMWRGERGFAAG